ncbi:MAG: glutaredoxin family protein [Actinomycetales bacterium]|nr:glutaredoxin family protein [Actinomycetales bacterium]
MTTPRLTLLGRPGCHLCDEARTVVERVLADHPGLALEERSIDDDPELQDRYAEEIPVLLIDDRVHTIWRVDEARLRRALGGGDAAPAGPRETTADRARAPRAGGRGR